MGNFGGRLWRPGLMDTPFGREGSEGSGKKVLRIDRPLGPEGS